MDMGSEAIKCLHRISKDIQLVLLAASVSTLHYVWFDVFQLENRTGFFCNDRNLMFPYKKSTVSTMTLLLYIATVLPFVVFLLTEIVKKTNKNCIEFMHVSIPRWFIETYKRMVLFEFGNYVQISLMLVPKFFDVPAFLRPHFFAVCQPQIYGNVNCTSLEHQNHFVTNYTCVGNGFQKSQIQNIYWSFPSGHTSTAFYAATYLIIYIQNHVRLLSVLRKLKLFFQFILLLVAIGIGISRIQDHHHHPVDVLVGAVLGVSVGVFAYFYGSQHYQKVSKRSSTANGTNGMVNVAIQT